MKKGNVRVDDMVTLHEYEHRTVSS